MFELSITKNVRDFFSPENRDKVAQAPKTTPLAEKQMQEPEVMKASVEKPNDVAEFQKARKQLELERIPRATIEFAAALHEKFQAREGITSGPGMERAERQKAIVTYQNKTYEVMVPTFNLRTHRDGNVYSATEPFEINVTINVMGENEIFSNFTFLLNLQEGRWSFESNKVDHLVSINEAAQLDPNLKLAEQLLRLAALQTEKELRETYPTRYIPQSK